MLALLGGSNLILEETRRALSSVCKLPPPKKEALYCSYSSTTKQTKKNLIEKWALLQKRHIDTQQAHEKILNITTY